jgi:hypothetical protein
MELDCAKRKRPWGTRDCSGNPFLPPWGKKDWSGKEIPVLSGVVSTSIFLYERRGWVIFTFQYLSAFFSKLM